MIAMPVSSRISMLLLDEDVVVAVKARDVKVELEVAIPLFEVVAVVVRLVVDAVFVRELVAPVPVDEVS